MTSGHWPGRVPDFFFFFGLWMLEVGVEAGWVFGTPQSIDKH